MVENQNSCCSQLRNEFQKRNFLFTHEPPDDFCKSQWQTSKKCIWWVIYRWCSTIFLLAGIPIAVLDGWSIRYLLVYFTNWGYSLCLFTLIYGSIISTIYYIKPNYFGSNSCSLKFFWLCYWLSAVNAACITSVYWSLRFMDEENAKLCLSTIWSHAINCIIMMLDYMLIAFPSRLLHFIYPFIFGATYIIFSIIYYKANGRNIFGRCYIYKKLDWTKPLAAILTALGCLLFTLIFSVILFGVYKLRISLYRKCLLKSTES